VVGEGLSAADKREVENETSHVWRSPGQRWSRWKSYCRGYRDTRRSGSKGLVLLGKIWGVTKKSEIDGGSRPKNRKSY